MGAERYATALASSGGGRMALTDWSIRREASVDFAYTDEQLEFKAKCRRFAAEVIRPVAAKHDREESTPWEVLKAARGDDDEWVLSGTKVFITNGGIADVHVIVATVDPALGHRGQASFVVPKGTPGLSQGKKESKLGIRASHTAEVILDDCRVPLDQLLGGNEQLERKLERARSGASSGRNSNALATFELTRPIVGASAIGIAQAAYEWTLEHLLSDGVIVDPLEAWLDESSTAGRPPLERQSVQQQLADVAMEIDAARLLVQRASWMGRNGIPLTGGQGSMSKLKGGDVAMWATRACMDLVGPFAQSSDCPLEKWFRDAKIFQLFEGTAEIQRRVVAQMQVAEMRRHFDEISEQRETAANALAEVAINGAATNGAPVATPSIA